MSDSDGAAFRAISDAVLAITAELSVEPVLQRLVHSARELARAQYAALGVPDGRGGFARFLTSGMSDQLVEQLGPLPRTHGLLGAMLESREPYRTPDVKQDPRFNGWWPKHHPDMHSFLGVPIVSRDGVIGAFYLTEKIGAHDFDDDDQRLIEVLAAHAAIAIENARLYERSRELSVVEERNRLARDLHDAVVQRLFGVVLTAEAAATVLDRDPAAARAQVAKVQELAREAIDELRAVVFELRPPELEREGLVPALRKHVEVLRRVHAQELQFRVSGDHRARPALDAEVFRIAQEALNNALAHGHAEHIDVSVEARNGRLRVVVADDGVGFNPESAALRSRRLGLTSMEERARALGAGLKIRSRPGKGTRIVLEVDVDSHPGR
jgi:signal transduction histidine kinase